MVRVAIFKNFRAKSLLRNLCEKHNYQLTISDYDPICGEINVKVFCREQELSDIAKIFQEIGFIEPCSKTVSVTLKEELFLLECFKGAPQLIEKLVNFFQQERGVLGKPHFQDKVQLQGTITCEVSPFRTRVPKGFTIYGTWNEELYFEDRLIASVFAADKTTPECVAHIDFLRAMFGRWPGMYWIQQANKHPDSKHPAIVRALKWMGKC